MQRCDGKTCGRLVRRSATRVIEVRVSTVDAWRTNFERGRPIELDAIVGAVAELGGIVGVDTLMVDAMYALIRRTARVDGH